jgi:hypothetical protein
MRITISFDEFVEFMYEALTDFGYIPTDDEVEVIVSLALDFFLETLGESVDMEEID